VSWVSCSAKTEMRGWSQACEDQLACHNVGSDWLSGHASVLIAVLFSTLSITIVVTCVGNHHPSTHLQQQIFSKMSKGQFIVNRMTSARPKLTWNSAQQRLSQVTPHLRSSEADIPRGRESITAKHPDDVVVTCALRTPFTKGGRGGFKDTPAADLLVGTFQTLLQRSQISPSLVEDIAVGSVLPPGGGATEFRAAALAAGFPESTAVKSLNRQCSSGLQACVDVANAIKVGMIEIGIGAGVESMSLQYGYARPSTHLRHL